MYSTLGSIWDLKCSLRGESLSSDALEPGPSPVWVHEAAFLQSGELSPKSNHFPRVGNSRESPVPYNSGVLSWAGVLRGSAKTLAQQQTLSLTMGIQLPFPLHDLLLSPLGTLSVTC